MSLVAWYKFDGNLVDSSTRGHHLTTKGSPVTYVDGIVDDMKAVHFSIKDQQLISLNTVQDFTKSFSVAFWLNTGNTYGCPVTLFGTYNTMDFYLYSNILYCTLFNEFHIEFENNIWNHFVINFDVDNAKYEIYINNQKINDGALLLDNLVKLKEIIIHRTQSGELPEGGFSLQDYRIYDCVLDEQMVDDVYNYRNNDIICKYTFSNREGTAISLDSVCGNKNTLNAIDGIGSTNYSIFEKGYYFNGSGARLQTSKDIMTNDIDAITFDVWFRLYESKFCNIFSINVNDGVRLIVYEDNTIDVYIGSSYKISIITNPLDIQHITISFRHGVMYAYHNGKLINTWNVGKRIILTERDSDSNLKRKLILGTYGYTREALNGTIGEFTIYDRCLSDSEILDYHNSKVIMNTWEDKRLCCHYKVDEDGVFRDVLSDVSNVKTEGVIESSIINDRCIHANNKFIQEDSRLFCMGEDITEISYSFWTKVSNYADADYMSVLICNSRTSYMRIMVGTTGIITIKYCSSVSDNNFIDLDNTATVPLNIWTHISVTLSDGIVRLYLDGKYIGKGAIIGSDSLKNFIDPSGLPKLLMNGFYLNHDTNKTSLYMDGVRVYNYGLSENEVRDIYNEPFEYNHPDSDLLAWYKLDGDCLDSSGNEKHANMFGGTLDASGKIGKAYCTNNTIGRDKEYIQTGVRPIDFKNKSACMAFWFYNDYDITRTPVTIRISGIPEIAGRNIFHTFIYNTDKTNNKYGDDFHISDGANSVVLYDCIPRKRWSHICMKYELQKDGLYILYVYINGKCIHKTDPCSPKIVSNEKILIGNFDNVYYHYANRYNDVRFYQTALSEQEIKRLYTTKILSYTFDDPYQEARKNIQLSDMDDPLSNMYKGVVYTKVGEENGYLKYSISGTWTGGEYPYSYFISTLKTEMGKCLSANSYIYTNVPDKFDRNLSGKLFSLIYVNEKPISSGVPYNDYISNYYTRYGIIPASDMMNRIYVVSQPKINQSFNPETDFMYIKDVMISNTKYPVPYCDPGDPVDGFVYDNSGYRNHGWSEYETTPHIIDKKFLPDTIQGASPIMGNRVAWFEPYSKFNFSNPFDGQLNTEQEFTINAWVCMTEENYNYIPLLKSNKHGCAKLIHAYRPILYLNSGDNDYYRYGNTRFPLNKWCMITFVFKNYDGTRNIYIDGELDNSDISQNKTYNPSDFIDIWDIFGSDATIYMSNLDIYATALDSHAVRDLYTQAMNFNTDKEVYAKHLSEMKYDYLEKEQNWNLIPNGTLDRGNTDYWKDASSVATLTYIDNDGPGTDGINRCIERNNISCNLSFDKIELYPDCEYVLEYSIKSNVDDKNRSYIAIVDHDKFNRIIFSDHVYKYDNTKTFITKPVHAGDTIVYLDSVDNWQDSDSPESHLRKMGICNFDDYSNYERCSSSLQYDSVDNTTNSIILSSPIEYSIPVGTKVANFYKFNTHTYIPPDGRHITTEWKNYSGSFINDRPSTRYIKITMLLYYSNNIYRISNVKLYNKTKPQLPPREYRIDIDNYGKLVPTHLQEGLSYGRNSILIKNVTLPDGDDYLSSMYKSPTGYKYFDVVNVNLDGTKDIIIPIWCDYINGELYMRVFRHDNHSGTLLFKDREHAKLNEIDDIFGHRYSLLSLLDNFKTNDGKYHFLLRYPHETTGKYTREDGTPKYNEWIQNNNPLSSGIIDTERFINIDMNSPNFYGLGLDTMDEAALLDGNGSSEYWYFAVGVSTNSYSGIPGDSKLGIIVNDTELWVKVNDSIKDMIYINFNPHGSIHVKNFTEDQIINRDETDYDNIVDIK